MNPQDQSDQQNPNPAMPGSVVSPAPVVPQTVSQPTQVPVNVVAPAQQAPPQVPPSIPKQSPQTTAQPLQNPVAQPPVQPTPQVPLQPISPQPVPTQESNVQAQQYTQTQQQPFTPAGFQQANFNQQGFQPGDIKPHKKGLANNKLFILIVALVAFTLVIGGWFAYSRLWVVDRTPALISFSNSNRALFKAMGGVTERQYTNLSFVNDDYSEEIDKTRNEKLDTVFEKLDEMIAKHEDESSKFNALRDPEFGKLASSYSEDVKNCSNYLKSLNTDINTFGPPLASLRESAGTLSGTNSEFSKASASGKTKLLNSAKSDYSTVLSSFKELDLKTDQVKSIRDGYVKKIQDVPFNDLLSDLKDPSASAFVPIYEVADFYDAGKEGMTQINHELDKGICHSDARDELNEIFKEHEFKEEDKDLLETVELF